MESPTVIVHFDSGDVLEHYGVLGMRWGFRKRKDYETYRSKIKEIKVNRKIERKAYIDSYKKNKQKFFKEVKEKGILKTLSNRVKNMATLTRALNDVDDKYLTKEIMADKRMPIKLRRWFTKNKNINYKAYVFGLCQAGIGMQVAANVGFTSSGQMYTPGDIIIRY